MKKTIIILNGPPGSGKDTAGDYIVSNDVNIKKEKFANPIKNSCKHIFSLTPEEYNYFETHGNKEIPDSRFFGKTWREVQIEFSENYLKAMYGLDIFGKLLKQRIEKSLYETFIITDGGFDEEIIPFLGDDNFNIKIIRLSRRGHNFIKDSRDYIMIPNIKIEYSSVSNNGNLEDFLNKIRREIYK